MKSRHIIIIASLALAAGTACASTVLIDFGDATTITTGQPETWNNATVPNTPTSALGFTGTLIADLVDITGASTGITMDVIDAFNTFNANGTTGSSILPSSASRDSFFGNDGTFSNYTDNGQGIIQFSGLNTNLLYSFKFFASRTGVSDNRETRYTLNGLNSGFGDLNATNNVNNTVSVTSIRPDAGGNILLTVEAGPNNNNGSTKFFYLGTAEITTATIPEPSSYALLAGFLSLATIGLRRQRQK